MSPRFRLCTIRKLKGKQKNYTNYTQTLHLTLHPSDSPCVAKCIVCASNYTQTIHKTQHWTQHGERPKPYTTASKPYTEPSTEHHVEVWKALPFREGLGVGFWKALPFREGLGVGFQKSNNFERIFSDSTLTFLTFGNTFRLLILPSWRAVLLCLPLIKIRGRQI